MCSDDAEAVEEPETDRFMEMLNRHVRLHVQDAMDEHERLHHGTQDDDDSPP